ncbi:hypothetical protein P3X46_034118 [Hevea brasiliensis]|uniref:DUF659 domain-containing protein n=1 Tax=Hevea brasiliensis TaxID=3981 RepID=A0ABQ9KAD8_HEVBR|nr:hypothetical protein P3X46_034118 [Hevea brasiliensis]
MKKVVEKISAEKVTQVVTDNEATIKAGGKKSMDKFPNLYWIACSVHCMDLILEDFEKRKSIKKIIDQARVITQFIYNHNWVVNYMKKFTDNREIICLGITRFATNFVALESIITSKFGQATSGPAYEAKKKKKKIVLSLGSEGSNFWEKAQQIIKIQEPLLKYLYDPCDIEDDNEIMLGLKNVIIRLESDLVNKALMFREKMEGFGIVLAQRAIKFINPTKQHRHLIVREIRVFFFLIYTKTRNRLRYQKLHVLVFVHYNMRLKVKNLTRKSQQELERSYNLINLDYIFKEDDLLNPWLEERESPLLDGESNPWLNDDDDINASLQSTAQNHGQEGGDGDSFVLSSSSDGNDDGDGREETIGGCGATSNSPQASPSKKQSGGASSAHGPSLIM